MIDTFRGRFVDFKRFVDAALGVRDPRRWWPLVVSLALTTGCSPRSAPGTVEDSLTSGRIRIACAPEARELIAREAVAFQALYPQATLEIREMSSRESVGALFGATADLAVVTRDLSVEERSAAVRGRLALEGYQFARDAVVLITNPANRVENVALDQVRRMYEADGAKWSLLGGENRPIEVVVLPNEADLTEYMIEHVMSGEAFKAPARPAKSEAEVVREVQTNASALGYVSLAAVRDSVRVLRLSSLTGLSYWKPDLEAVYRGDYPLTRYFSLYMRTEAPKLAAGFVTYVTSRDGQDLVRQQGLVPTAVPVRFVRRSPMLGTHQESEEKPSRK